MELKAALVGCGAMSRAWLQAAAKIPDLRIVGLADLDAARAQDRAAEFGLNDVVIARDVDALDRPVPSRLAVRRRRAVGAP